MTFVALSVQTSGRNRPEASANPATAPDGSAVGRSLTAYTVPDVPMEMATSPGRSPTPSAAAMLSPVPGATTARRQVPAGSNGASTSGTTDDQSRSASTMPSRSQRYVPVCGDQ